MDTTVGAARGSVCPLMIRFRVQALNPSKT